jgi:hypothetical protein
MAKHTTLPQPALDGAAGPAQDHLPTVLPPVPETPPTVTLPEEVQISETGLNHLPDWVSG